jgi:hypothetical protein
VGFSVVAFVFSLAYLALGFLAPHDGTPYLVRGLAVLVVARIVHVIARGQLLANLNMIQALFGSPALPKDPH